MLSSFKTFNNYRQPRTLTRFSRIILLPFWLLNLTFLMQAATFTVTKTTDTNDGICNADCSLREAVAETNAATGDDVILFDSNVFNTAQTILLTNGIQLEITNNGALVINGTGSNLLLLNGNNTSRVFRILAGANVTINDVNITNGGGSAPDGSGISNAGNLTLTKSIINGNRVGGLHNESGILNVINVSVTNNTRFSGAGIFNQGGQLNITNSTISGNSANGGGGGISNGGGMVIIDNSTINNNNSSNSAGAIFHFSGKLEIKNSTISNNTTTLGGTVGGILNNIGTVDLKNVTLADNQASGTIGGIRNQNGGIVNVRNSIIANNVGNGISSDIAGTVNSQGYNLIKNISGATITGITTGNIVGQDPMLGLLQFNGTIPFTRALLTGSPAIDSGNPSDFLPTDQRSVPRPLDGDINGTALPDIGAFEKGEMIVTKVADTNDGICNADCSLREAVIAANSSSANDVIMFSSLFTSPQTIILGGTELSVTNNGNLTINGTGSNLLTVSGNNSSRVFLIAVNSKVSINNLRITGGNSANGQTVGGGIQNSGELEIRNLIINNNRTGFGGGINNSGNLIVESSIISDNAASSECGGIRNTGSLAINNSTFSNNSAQSGGAIRSSGNSTAVTINNSTFRGNTLGGAIYNTSGNMIINNSNFADNSSISGGALRNDATMTVNNSIIRNNNATNFGGGGIYNTETLNINNSTINNNSSTNGGGILTEFGVANITGSTIRDNTTLGNGGGINNNNSNLTIVDSTVSGNTSLSGGGINNSSNSNLTVSNCTISNNQTTSFEGGGINNSGTVNIMNSTVGFNSAGRGGGGIQNFTGTVNVRNTIISNNSVNAVAVDFNGTLNSQGFNLIKNTDGAIITGITTGNILGQDAQLLPLRNYGGVMQTIALQPTSPAIDAGDPDNFPPLDQRGISRPQDGDINGTTLPDIGAYERQVTTFHVTKTIDTNDAICNSDCSLREAIAATRSSANSDNVILFTPTVFSTSREIRLTNGELEIDNFGTLFVKGTGANLLTISGNLSSRILINFNRATTVSGVTMKDGNGVGAFNNGFGGAVNNENGIFTLLDSVIVGNRAINGGGVRNSNGTFIINNSVISGNLAESNAGGVFNSNSTGIMTITDSTVRGNNSIGAGGIDNRGTLSLSGLLVVNNLSNNSGGGLINFGTGKVTVTNSTFQNNNAREGGGIYNFGFMSVNASTLNGNASNSVNGIGGGIYNSSSTGVLTLQNSTVSGNFAANGAGIHNQIGSVTINFSTVGFNSATSGSGNGQGGGIVNLSGTVNLRNTIVAANLADSNIAPDFSGTVNSQGYNLIKNINGTTVTGVTTGNILGQDPLLDPILRLNGGATRTHALRLNSPAIDKGAAVAGITTDQRGLLRPLDFPSVPNAAGGNGSDIGASEKQVNDVSSRVFADFDGDGKSDVSVFRPSDTVWYSQKSSDSQVLTTQWGIAADKIVPADYNGDGKTDYAVFRDGFWYVLLNGGGFEGYQWGQSGDVPFPGDFDADGKDDLAVFRNGTWFVLKSSGGTVTQNWGSAGDIPVIADYDGDSKADFAVYRNGIWYVLKSTGGDTAVQWGIAGDKTVQGDYNGDGKADYAVFRNGFWYVLLNGGGFVGAQWGASGDLPAPADYDGDGKIDLAVFRNGVWYIQRTTAGVQVVNFGSAGDKPTPNAFVP